MSWKKVTVAGIQSAMTLNDHLGLDKFRELYGFHKAKDIHMYWHGRGPYEARPLLAAAFAHLNPAVPAIKSTDFKDNDAHVFLAEKFGFDLRKI